MIRFYAPDINATAVLPESDSQHCCRVLRMHEGDELECVDGVGGLYRCSIALAHPKHTEIEVIERLELANHWKQTITLAVAPTKHNDRMEWMVEKLTEIGVDRIVMLKCERSERKEIKADRLRKIAVSAMKQSLKATLPYIDEMVTLPEFVKSLPRDGQRFVAYCDPEAPERHLLAREYEPGKDTTLLIGPEGDFSPSEIALTLDSGFKAVTLGDTRLRTETAAIVGCDTFHIIDQATL